ncbi:MAG TPA: hypothetical protein RMG48_06190 [Myxococcales bacterium LLY-WYZ-16_1]|nr:hypothetical protein [Myxococcales bacterium LLY-WYZ-16_1]
MVRKGEYLERATVIPGPDGPLEGLFHRGKKRLGVLIAPPSPRDGATMESSVVAELAWALTRAGHPTLRFNYRGVGASTGALDLERPAPELDPDLESAREHLVACLPEKRAELGACGLGQSGPRLLHLARNRPLCPLMLVAPDPRELPPPDPVWSDVVVAYPQHGPPPGGFEPVQAWVDGLPNGHLARIAGADSGFRRGLVELGQLAVSRFSPVGEIDLGEG